jgi:hypothetical protein
MTGMSERLDQLGGRQMNEVPSVFGYLSRGYGGLDE